MICLGVCGANAIIHVDNTLCAADSLNSSNSLATDHLNFEVIPLLLLQHVSLN